MNKVWIITLVSALGIQSAAAQTANDTPVTEEKNVPVVQEINPSTQVYTGSFAARKAAFKKNLEVRRQQIAERKKQVEQEEKEREEYLARLAEEKAAAEAEAEQKALNEEYSDEIQVRPIIEQSESEYAPTEEKTEEKAEEETPEVEVNSSDELFKEIESLRKSVELLNKSGDNSDTPETK